VRHLVVELVTKNLVKPVGAGLLEIEGKSKMYFKLQMENNLMICDLQSRRKRKWRVLGHEKLFLSDDLGVTTQEAQ